MTTHFVMCDIEQVVWEWDRIFVVFGPVDCRQITICDLDFARINKLDIWFGYLLKWF